MRWRLAGLVIVMSLGTTVEAKTIEVRRNDLRCTPVDASPSASVVASQRCVAALRAALGEKPGFQLAATRNGETQGSISVAECNPIRLGVDRLQFKYKPSEIATLENVGPWLEEQGHHHIVSITGNVVTCDAIITVTIYEQDEAPNANHPEPRKRPAVMPTDADIVSEITNAVMP